MANSPNLGFTLVSASQNQKEVTVNEALLRVDALLNNSVIDKDLATPPGSPSDGDLYIVAGSPTGAWVGHAGDLAYYNSGWRFIDPQEGIILWVADEDINYLFDGASWTSAIGGGAFSTLGIGGATADATNKLSVTTPAVLFNGAVDDIQVKVNKAATGDDAAFLFQTGFSTRALIGALGDDDFTFKVSPDGSAFHTSFIIDKDNGNVEFNQNIKASKFIQFPAAATLTIATGEITVTQSTHKIETEAAAASDDLDTILGGVEGYVIILEPLDDTHTVVITQSGNIRTASGASVSLDNYGDTFTAKFDGTNWIQI